MLRELEFFVRGLPRPKGSTSAFHNKKGRIITRASNAKVLEPWAETVGVLANEAGARMWDGAVRIDLEFRFPRSRAHYEKGKTPTAFDEGNLAKTAPFWVTKTPDLDKLQRAVLDALTGIVWRDDSQVAMINATKVFGGPMGVNVRASKMDDSDGAAYMLGLAQPWTSAARSAARRHPSDPDSGRFEYVIEPANGHPQYPGRKIGFRKVGE